MLQDLYTYHIPQPEEELRQEIPEQEQLLEEVYADLPPLLAKACSFFKEPIERDVFLLGALAVLSGILPNVFGVYDNKRVGPNIFIFIVGSAGGGKGSLTWVRKLIDEIHQYRRELSMDGKVKLLLIPANNSSSGVIETLHNNNERGILMCTEADTLSGALTQDWGNFSDLLRASFHHEFYEMMRRANKEYYELKRPYLSLLLSGTPAQVHNLIPSAENGLFSRFGFYSFEIKPKMKNVFATNEMNFDDEFKLLSNDLLKFYKRLEARTHAIEFEFTAAQKSHFLSTFNEWHDEFFVLLGKESIATIRRLGLILFRLAMILTIFKQKENEVIPNKVFCDESEFNTALLIISTLKKHAAKMFSQFSKQKDAYQFKGKKLQLFKMLPDHEFSRSEALGMANRLEIPRATFDRFLQSEAFEKIGHGTYQKQQ